MSTIYLLIVVLYLSSTSNHNTKQIKKYCEEVVLYLSSTSNHNYCFRLLKYLLVVLYLSSTSNHNKTQRPHYHVMLCYIFLLHQTTTKRPYTLTKRSCVISFFYIKPQQPIRHAIMMLGCVISFFYIKPQPSVAARTRPSVVLYLSSTSNHNKKANKLHLTQVVLYLSSTSNHNSVSISNAKFGLCYIFLLHQTTTGLSPQNKAYCCVISFFYIKPQL